MFHIWILCSTIERMSCKIKLTELFRMFITYRLPFHSDSKLSVFNIRLFVTTKQLCCREAFA